MYIVWQYLLTILLHAKYLTGTGNNTANNICKESLSSQSLHSNMEHKKTKWELQYIVFLNVQARILPQKHIRIKQGQVRSREVNYNEATRNDNSMTYGEVNEKMGQGLVYLVMKLIRLCGWNKTCKIRKSKGWALENWFE